MHSFPHNIMILLLPLLPLIAINDPDNSKPPPSSPNKPLNIIGLLLSGTNNDCPIAPNFDTDIPLVSLAPIPFTDVSAPLAIILS